MKRSRNGVAFTLVEILIVIGIIGILAGLLVPVTGWARERARDTQCMGNLKAIGLAVMNYVHKQNGYLPPCGASKDVYYDAWYRSIMIDNWKVYACPSKYTSVDDVPAVLPEKDDETPTGKQWAVNYGMNFQLFGAAENLQLLGNTFQIDSVSALSVIFLADGGTFAGEEEIDPGEMEPKNELPDSVKEGGLYFPDSETGKVPANKPTVSPRHGGQTMCWFLDNHAEMIDTQRILRAKRGEDDCLYDAALGQ